MSLFREYDIRGIAESQLTNEFCFALGRVLGKIIASKGSSRVTIGRDVRLSSQRIAGYLAKGFQSADIQCRLLVQGPTPLVYFECASPEDSWPCQSGVMVTGSHNPSEYNGFKMVMEGKPFFGEDIQKLVPLVENELARLDPSIDFSQTAVEFAEYNSLDRYVDFFLDHVKIGSKKIKLVVDAGNGAAGQLALKCYEKMGCEVIPLFCEFDGRFPNHHPDPTVEKNLVDLKKAVTENNADFGIAFDGDGDRIGAVTASGKMLYGDQLLLYLAKDLLKDVPGATIISEVKSSQVLYNELERLGAQAIVWKTGHSLIKSKLKETGALLAGEMSGHIFFAHRYLGFDDAVYTGGRLIEILQDENAQDLDSFLQELPKVINTPEMRIDCDDQKKFEVVESFTAQAKAQFGDDVLDIDGARVKFPNGWGLLRASNTQPVLVMRFEADSSENLNLIKAQFAKILEKVAPDVKVPD